MSNTSSMAGARVKASPLAARSNEFALTRQVCATVDTIAPTEGVKAETLVQHMEFVWRVLRWMGVREPDLEDATQRVFLIVVAKAERIRPGSERAYLFTTAARLARRVRRSRRDIEDADRVEAIDPSVDPETHLAHRQTLALLDQILSQMPDELREVFLLCEVEQLTMREASEMLSLPAGTIASRLRRAREEIERGIHRAKAQFRGRGSP